MQDKLTEVRAKADEAREAALRATAALHEGLSAAYDFALDAETSPEEYLRLVEAQGLKIQLRAPMAPVAKLAFDGLGRSGHAWPVRDRSSPGRSRKSCRAARCSSGSTQAGGSASWPAKRRARPPRRCT